MRHTRIAVVLTGFALAGVLTGTGTAVAESSARSVTEDECQAGGGGVITILGRGACLGGEFHTESVKW
ncbi:hypothetical protein [Parasphingorhabdus pacifica]